MGIVIALDVHRSQITYKSLDRHTGELRRGRIAPATRREVRAWLRQFADRQAELNVAENCLPRQERILLEHVGCAPVDPGQRFSEHGDLSFARGQQAGNHVQER